MPKGLFGANPIARGNYQGPGYTFIEVVNSSAFRGMMKFWSVYMNNDQVDGAKVKVFRDDGTNYVFIGESAGVHVNAHLNSNLVCAIPVQIGDLIGAYIYEEIECGSTANGIKYKAGDITANSLKSGWSSTVGPLSVQGTVFWNKAVILEV
jgi:hypothetical protein